MRLRGSGAVRSARPPSWERDRCVPRGPRVTAHLRKHIVNTFMTLDGIAQAPGGPEELDNATKYVASTTLTSVEWQTSQLLDGPLADAVNAVKAQGGTLSRTR